MNAATGTSVEYTPWRSRPSGQLILGRAVEAALGRDAGSPVGIDAFEAGTLRIDHRGWKTAALVLLSPVWIPLFMFASLIMVIPSWIYFPVRTYREWDEARSLGVSAGVMIFGVLLVFGFGAIGGLVMTMIVLGKLIDLGNVVIVARTGDRLALLHQRMPVFNFPEYRKIEYLPGDAISLDPTSTQSRIVLSLRSASGVRKIGVRRLPAWVAGAPEVNDGNLNLLLYARPLTPPSAEGR